jgi:DNA-binding CsgD family transcriptional regulator
VARMHEVLHREQPDLTNRQREVVALIAAGCSNEEVGDRLGISPRTAKAHADVLRQKLGALRTRPRIFFCSVLRPDTPASM